MLVLEKGAEFAAVLFRVTAGVKILEALIPESVVQPEIDDAHFSVSAHWVPSAAPYSRIFLPI